MGLFKHLRKSFKKLGNDITHPRRTIKKIDRDIKKVEREIVKTATKVEKFGAKTIHQARNITHIIAKNAKIIDSIIDIAASAADVIAASTGQVELIAGVESLRMIAKKGVDAAQKAEKAIDTAEKFIHVATAIKNKEDAGKIMKQTAQAFTEAGELSGNTQLQHVAKQLTKGSEIAGKVIEHSKELHKMGKKAVKVVKNKDIEGALKLGVESVNKAKQIKKDVKAMKSHTAPPHPGMKTVVKRQVKKDKKPPTPKNLDTSPLVEEEKVEEIVDDKKVIVKKEKKKRKLSAYNIFVSKHRKNGKSMKEIGQMWKQEKMKK